MKKIKIFMLLMMLIFASCTSNVAKKPSEPVAVKEVEKPTPTPEEVKKEKLEEEKIEVIAELEETKESTTTFEELGIVIERTADTIDIKITKDGIETGKYDEILSSLVQPINYQDDTVVTIFGNTEKINFINNYLINEGVEKEKIEMLEDQDAIVTTIIIKKK